MTFDAEQGKWETEDGILRVTTPQWYCEGPIGVGELYLVCTPPSGNQRLELEMVITRR